MQHDTIIILDYGSQYSQLIARRVREANVYCELFSWRTDAEIVLAHNPKGFILSGGPTSVYDRDAPRLPDYVLSSGVPVLGICYGMQLLVFQLGGAVAGSRRREYGQATLRIDKRDNLLFAGWKAEEAGSMQQVWMSHGDKVDSLPSGLNRWLLLPTRPWLHPRMSNVVIMQFNFIPRWFILLRVICFYVILSSIYVIVVQTGRRLILLMSRLRTSGRR